MMSYFFIKFTLLCKSLFIVELLFKECPGTAVIGDTVRTGVWRIVGYLLTTVELALLRVDCMNVRLTIIADRLPFLAVAANAGEAFRTGEYDVAFLIVPCVGLVLLEDRELNGVNHLKVFKAQPECHCRNDVNLYQCLTTLEIVP